MCVSLYLYTPLRASRAGAIWGPWVVVSLARRDGNGLDRACFLVRRALHGSPSRRYYPSVRRLARWLGPRRGRGLGRRLFRRLGRRLSSGLGPWRGRGLKHWTKPFITSACASSSPTRAPKFWNASASQTRRERATMSFIIVALCDRFTDCVLAGLRRAKPGLTY